MRSVNVQNVAYNNRYEIPSVGDWVLIDLVKQADKVGLEVGVLLNLGGILLSGTLIGGKKYFEAIQSQALELGEANATLSEILNRIAQDGRNVYDVPLPNEEDRLPTYIHLLDVNFIDTNGKSTGEVTTMWRGKIVDVTGFCLRTIHNE